jgi:DNA-binding transcriptional LysR family regulator
MEWRTVTFDWNQARAFLVTAEEGSLSAAARALGLTQPTVGRQVSALEEHLGVTLFERDGRTLTLTEGGRALLRHVRGMGDAAGRLSLAASGQSQTIDGSVSITASDIMATILLPRLIGPLRQLAPNLEIEVIAANDVRDLRRREADIAIRNVKTDQPDLVTKFVRETTAHMYASSDLLDRIGRPKTTADLEHAPFIGLLDSQAVMTLLRSKGLPLSPRNFMIRSENSVANWEMVKLGLGIGMMVKEVGDRTKGLEMVLPDFPPFPVPVWLTAHRELRTSRRMRVVFDYLADSMSDPTFPGEDAVF